MITKASLFGAILCLVSFTATGARADVIFSDFGSGDSYVTNSGDLVSGASSGVPPAQSFSAEFASAAFYDVSEIDLALVSLLGVNAAVVSLWTDNGGSPGAQIGSWAISGQPPGGSSGPPTAITGISGVDLLAGANYWLMVSPGDPTTTDGWDQNNQGATGAVDGSTLLTGATLPAFRVYGTQIPEPTSLALFGASLMGLRLLRRRRC